MTRRCVWVGTEKGGFVFESGREGNGWTLRGPFLKGWKVFSLLLDTRSEPVLYAAVGHDVYGPAIHLSKDLGVTWQQVEHGPAYDADSGFKLNNVWCVAAGPAEAPEILYAGVDEAGIFISRDGGWHWQEMPGLSRHPTRGEWMPGAGGMCCHTVLVDPQNPRRLYAGISAVGVFRSDDGGDTWHTKNEGVEVVMEMETHKDIGRCVHRLALDPANPERLYQQNHMGVFRSLNGGEGWERIENGLSSRFGFPLVIDPANPDTLYVIPLESDEYRFVKNGRLAVYRSQDGGDSWHSLSRGFPRVGYVSVLRQALAADGAEGIYFGTTGGTLFCSQNGGEDWGALPQQLPRIYSVSTSLAQ